MKYSIPGPSQDLTLLFQVLVRNDGGKSMQLWRNEAGRKEDWMLGLVHFLIIWRALRRTHTSF